MGEGQEVLGERKAAICLWVPGSGFLEGQLKSDRCLGIYFRGGRGVQAGKGIPWRRCTIWRALGEAGFFGFFWFFPDALDQNMTFAMASDPESLWPPWVDLVPAWSLAVCIQSEVREPKE